MSDSVTEWTVAHQSPLSMELSRQEYWSGLPCLPPVDLPDPGIKPESPGSPALQAGLYCWVSGACTSIYHIFMYINVFIYAFIQVIPECLYTHMYIQAYIQTHIFQIHMCILPVFMSPPFLGSESLPYPSDFVWRGCGAVSHGPHPTISSA